MTPSPPREEIAQSAFEQANASCTPGPVLAAKKVPHCRHHNTGKLVMPMIRRISLKPRESIITRADRARDDGHWERAAQLYRRALRRNPRNPPIWVQYGHALKEAGDLQQAEVAYRTSIAHDPSASDPWLQLGRILKLSQKAQEAQIAYLQASALDPSSPDWAAELVSLGWSDAQLGELRRLTT